MFSNDMLLGKTVLVTGANQGLGYAMALGLVKHGADVFNIGLGDDSKIKEAVTALGRQYRYLEQDLTKIDQAKADALVADCVSAYGKVDVLLNNAGVNIRHPLLEYPEKDWDFVIALDLKAVFLLSQAVAKQFVSQKSKGKIINVASMLSYTGGILVAPYTSAKSAVMGLTKEMSNELSSKGINVNAIAPGYMDTEMTKAIQEDPERNKEIMLRLPAGYWGPPESLQGACVFLASGESDYICGVTIPVDGGWLGR
jgi:2-deoxy-D-gluconate 3-dehydrogenase